METKDTKTIKKDGKEVCPCCDHHCPARLTFTVQKAGSISDLQMIRMGLIHMNTGNTGEEEERSIRGTNHR